MRRDKIKIRVKYSASTNGVLYAFLDVIESSFRDLFRNEQGLLCSSVKLHSTDIKDLENKVEDILQKAKDRICSIRECEKSLPETKIYEF
jgi:hypothetical protein